MNITLKHKPSLALLVDLWSDVVRAAHENSQGGDYVLLREYLSEDKTLEMMAGLLRGGYLSFDINASGEMVPVVRFED